jgi:hypothetical protein
MSFLRPRDIARLFQALAASEDPADRAKARLALAQYLKDIDSRASREGALWATCSGYPERIILAARPADSKAAASRLGCAPTHEEILAHFDEHGSEPGYFLKLTGAA